MSCIICRKTERRYLFTIGGSELRSCEGCGLVSREKAVAASSAGRSPVVDPITELDASHRYLEILKNTGLHSGKVLLAGKECSGLSALLEDQGFTVTKLSDAVVESPGKAPSSGQYDAIILL
ncbi:MAG TPA: hypothetical protein V6C72_14640, partial [Chroococcales cyanobacterium]